MVIVRDSAIDLAPSISWRSLRPIDLDYRCPKS
jgi:hypothetical protein